MAMGLLPALATGTLVVAGAIVTLDAAVRLSATILGRTVGQRSSVKRSIRKLSANETGRFFESVLGIPQIERTLAAYRERVWAHRLYFVQALTDGDDRVAIYSVVSRRPSFRLKVPIPGGGWHAAGQKRAATIILGRTHFADIPWRPERITAALGARRSWYAEVFYLGNPGHYQHLVLSINDAASATGDASGVISLMQPAGEWPDISTDDPGVHSARQRAAPNAYSVTAPLLGLADIEATHGLFGADQDEVRALPNW